jgi:hypothetical protein
LTARKIVRYKVPNVFDGVRTEAAMIEIQAAKDHGARHDESLRNYREHFVEPPPEFVRKRLQTFDAEPAMISELLAIIICGVDRWVKVHPKFKFDPSIYEIDPYVRYVNVRSLDHLKALAGVPNEVHEYARKYYGECVCATKREVAWQHLPPPGFRFDRLDSAERTAVHDLSFNLLHGHADEAMVSKPPYKSIADYLLQRAKVLPTFVGNDLLVCPDQTVQFSGFAAVYFNNVVVVGNGRIFLGAHTKLHAYQIKHL